MAIVTNRVNSDAASTASFEVTNNAGSEAATVIDTASLVGAGDNDNQAVLVTRVVATVVNTDPATGSFVTLSWGDGTEFLHLGPGVSDINTPFEHNNIGTPNTDVVVTAADDTLFTLRIFVKKMTGYPKSMGHARNRP